MLASKFEVAMVGDIQPGDRWYVEAVDPEKGTATFARACAPAGQYRSYGDGLHPRFPDTSGLPISEEEARRCAEEMEAAMEQGKRDFIAAARAHDELMARALREDGG